MNFERKWCHECSGIQLFGEHKGKACCSIMSRILKDSETGEPIRAYMDKETTRNMCRNLGEGCPILTKAQAAGLIRNAGKRECSVTGRSAIAWKAEKEVFHGNKPNHKGNPEGEL